MANAIIQFAVLSGSTETVSQIQAVETITCTAGTPSDLMTFLTAVSSALTVSDYVVGGAHGLP